MNYQQVQDIRLMYEAVYNEELREKADEYNNEVNDEDIVEVATEYFYTYGLNQDGIDILIEKVGLENFVEFVYDLSEDLHVLTEARRARRRTGGESYEDVKAKIDAKEAAKKKAKEAAQQRTETEKRAPESKGADTEAKAQQPKKKPIRDAIARQVLAGMERHRKAMELARETGKTVAKAASVAHEAGRRAGEHVKKHGLKSLANEEADLFDYLLEYLVAEGYADTNQNALVIMANMNKEQIEEATRLYYKLQRRGKGSSSVAKAQERSDADLKTQKNEKMEKQRQRQMREREPDDDDPRQHGSLSAAERNPSMR